MKDTVYAYILKLIRSTREHPDIERRKSEGYDCSGKDGKSMGMDGSQRLCDTVRCKLPVSLCCGTQDYFVWCSGNERKKEDRSAERNIEGR